MSDDWQPGELLPPAGAPLAKIMQIKRESETQADTERERANQNKIKLPVVDGAEATLAGLAGVEPR